ncbi:MAG: dTDP-4-dehydrorhamnose 3,5-epimerase [Terracidiphilus sp.]|jgi:dTDP-4-dehydrorhamnose 3,5-epimerase
MIFHETKLEGVVVIEPEYYSDDRGFFARSWCEKTFQEHSLTPKIVQCNISMNKRIGTLRGMHYQIAPVEEAKLVRCMRGSIFDVAIDLRAHSKTFMQWTGIELTAENHLALYIPEGCAHGFLTMEEETEVFYQMSEYYHPEAQRGVRWNDPVFGIDWPGTVQAIADRDREYPDFELR